MAAPTFLLDVRPDGRVWLLIETGDGGSASVDLDDVAEILHPQHAEVVRRAVRMAQEGYLLKGRTPTVDVIEWICESHPWLPYPHDRCHGPGMPAADRATMHERESVVPDAYFRALTRLLDAVRGNDAAAVQATLREIDAMFALPPGYRALSAEELRREEEES